VLDRENVSVAFDDRIDASIIVLVEDDRAEVPVALRCERGQEPCYFILAADRGNEEIDQRLAGARDPQRSPLRWPLRNKHRVEAVVRQRHLPAR